MASNNKKNQPIEHNSSSSSDSSIDPWLWTCGQDLMEGQDDMELIPTQDLQWSPKPKKKQSKKQSLSAASMDMFHTQPSTSSNYDFTNTQDIQLSIDNLPAYTPQTNTQDIEQSINYNLPDYSQRTITILNTLDLVDDAAFDFPPEKKAKLASESQSQTQYSQHYTGKLTERNLKNVSEELSYMGSQLTSENIEKAYALHCAKFIYQYLNKQDPHNAERRKLRKEIIEKNCLEEPILDL